MGQHDIVKQTIKNTNLSQKYRTEKKEKNELKAELKTANNVIKTQDDLINAQVSEIDRLEKLIAEREEQDSLIICKNKNGAITHITHTLPYNERVALQEVKGINLTTICKKPLYAKIPFLYEEEGVIKIDNTKYNKYKIVGGII